MVKNKQDTTKWLERHSYESFDWAQSSFGT